MRVCAAVPCYNGEATLKATLESLLAQTQPPDEIVVVDDGSRDGSRAVAESYPVRLSVHDTNAGLSTARNTALSATDCEIILYVDADAQADPELVATIMAGFTGEDVVGVGGQGIESNIHSLADRWRALHAAQGHGSRRLERCDFLFGLCMAYRRTALLAVGGFSPLFRTNAEDMDIGFRLTAAGGRLRYDPTAQVTHQRQDGTASLLRTLQAWYYWAYVARAANRRKPWTLWVGTLRRAVWEPLCDLLLRGDGQLAALGVRATETKLRGLRRAAADWRAGAPGRAWLQGATE
jgi:glycosyltransferase involved in cell wall biosynthesis